MSIHLMSLGQWKFYVPLPEYDTPGYETLQRDSQYTWIPQGRLNAPVAMQSTGPGQDVIVIEGRLFPHHFGGISTLNGLRESGAAGKPMTLIRYYPVQNDDGVIQQGITAEILGDFALMRVRSGEKYISSVGMAHHIDFSLELCAYGNDGQLRSQAATGSQST